MPIFNVLVLPSLTHIIAYRLNLKYTCRAVMAEWLTDLTKDVGVPGSSLSGWNANIQCFSAAQSYTYNCLSFKFKVYMSCCDGRVVNGSDQGRGGTRFESLWIPIKFNIG